jgi:hypothetical protein
MPYLKINAQETARDRLAGVNANNRMCSHIRSRHAAKHHRLDFQALRFTAHDFVQRCQALRTHSLSTRQVQGIACRHRCLRIENQRSRAMKVGGLDRK